MKKTYAFITLLFKKFHFIFWLTIFLPTILISGQSMAQGGPAGGPIIPGAGSASCDFTAIKESLGATESGGNYAAICYKPNIQPPVECDGGARGKYQFIRNTRSGYIRSNPQCNGSDCDSDEAWISPQCYGVQECIMDAYLAEKSQYMLKACGSFIIVVMHPVPQYTPL